jgi:hypothetical protein
VNAITSHVDWSAPWLVDWQAESIAIRKACAAEQPAFQALNASAPAGLPVRFVPQMALPPGQAYEAFVAQTAQVPTRDNLHDLFNGWVWQRFPAAKAALNRLQMGEIARDGVQATRGPVRDAATVFDENGAVLWGPQAEPVWRALCQHDWATALQHNRSHWLSGQVRLTLFGHALMEKLVAPRKEMVAHLLWLPGCNNRLVLDGQLSQHLEHTMGQLAGRAKPFQPLPVLGVPGWCEDNANHAFYTDAKVFRPKRSVA